MRAPPRKNNHHRANRNAPRADHIRAARAKPHMRLINNVNLKQTADYCIDDRIVHLAINKHDPTPKVVPLYP